LKLIKTLRRISVAAMILDVDEAPPAEPKNKLCWIEKILALFVAVPVVLICAGLSLIAWGLQRKPYGGKNRRKYKPQTAPLLQPLYEIVSIVDEPIYFQVNIVD
jgi:hypothetical protein